jgi:hypothetical protein
VLRRYLELSAPDRRLLIEAFALVAAMRIALRTMRFESVRRMAGRMERPRSSAVAPERIAWAVGAVARRIPGATCLAQALAARVMLARRRMESRLRIGVKKDGESVAAHAWVEHRGRVIVGGESSAYAPLVEMA